MRERPFAFVCSPFRGDMEANAEQAREYSRQVYEAGYCPLTPHLLFPQFLREDIPAEREAGIGMGLSLLARCQTLVVCGGRITEGMAEEIRRAGELGIPACTLDTLSQERGKSMSGNETAAAKWNSPVDVVCDGELTAFPTRRTARDFFFECMCGTEGSERERYTAIVIGLEETGSKMVHDGDPREDNPRVHSVCRFKGDHIGDRRRLDKPTTYSACNGGKNSLITKIREAREAAKNNPPSERSKTRPKKSPEPEM